MIYMGNPMQYYEKDVAFVRGVLLSGPLGTGKTLFARTLAKKSGLPFVFASGAEFTDSEKSGSAKINEMFSVARRNAPAFVFVDEIDVITGRHARKDPRRRATLEALIAQLDEEKEKTGVDRFSLRQAVIFICATNRPDELDLEFVRSGRIDRRQYIGLHDAKQRVQIFGVHSAGKNLIYVFIKSLADNYQIPGAAATCDLLAIMDGYYKTMFPLNASGIQPTISSSGDQESLLRPRNKDLVGKGVESIR